MKSKILTSFMLSIMFVALVAAAISLSISATPSTLTSVGDTTSFTIDSVESADFTFPSTATITDSDNNKVELSISTTSDLTGENSVAFNVEVTSVESDFSFATESVEVIIGADNLASAAESITVPLTFERTYCEAGEVGDLDIRLDINNNGRGSDDEWYLLDDLDIEVRVENDGNDDIDDVTIEWVLINENTGEVIDDNDLKDFNLKDGEKETKTFNLELNPDDFSTGDAGSNFRLLVKAYGDKDGEDAHCISSSEVAELRGGDFIAVDINSINLPDSLKAGESLEVSAKVWNIGDDDQQDVTVRVQVQEFNFDKTIDIGDVDELEDQRFSFTLDIPSDARDGTYGLRFEVYDEDGDIFEDEDDDEAIFFKTFDVRGGTTGTGNTQASVGIVANLESNAVAGEELIVKSTITNTGTESTSYTVLITGYDTWAKLDSIEPRTFTLSSGESRDVRIKLMPNADADGTQEFTLQVVYNGIITEQVIEVPIQASTGPGITGGAIGAKLSGNWFIWLVALINVVLVILIIVVAVRMASR